MTEDVRDPALEALFRAQHQELPEQPFLEQLMSRTDRSQRRSLYLRIAAAVTIALAALTFQDVALALTQIPLVTLEEGLLAQLLAPVNHLGSLLSLVLIGFRVGYRKLFARPIMR